MKTAETKKTKKPKKPKSVEKSASASAPIRPSFSLNNDVLKYLVEFILSGRDFVSLLTVCRHFRNVLSGFVPQMQDKFGAFEFNFLMCANYWEIRRKPHPSYWRRCASTEDGYTIQLHPSKKQKTMSIPEGFQRELQIRRLLKPHIWSQLDAVHDVLWPKYSDRMYVSSFCYYEVGQKGRWQFASELPQSCPLEFDRAELEEEQRNLYLIVRKYGQLLFRIQKLGDALHGISEVTPARYCSAKGKFAQALEAHYINGLVHGRKFQHKGQPREVYCDYNMGVPDGKVKTEEWHTYPIGVEFLPMRIKVRAKYKNSKFHGKYRGYQCFASPRPDVKRLILSQTFVEGCLDGVREEYYPSQSEEGKMIKIVEAHYRKGAIQEYTQWDNKLGIMIHHCTYLEGKHHGEEVTYHRPDHTTKPEDPPLLMTTVHWINGMRQGKEQRYHRNGKIAFEATWKNDYLTGEQRVFSDQGNLLHECTWDRKRPGVKDGKEQQWSERTGQLIYSAMHKDGKETKVQRWDDNGKAY